MGGRLWTKEEQETFCRLYGTMSNVELGRLLGRTKDSIAMRASLQGRSEKLRYWTAEEDAYLKENPEKTYSELASHLGRSITAIGSRRKKLGLGRKLHYWTQEEIDYVAKHATTDRIVDIARHLGHSVGATGAVLRRVSSSQVQPSRRWTAEEDEYIRKEYGFTPSEWIAGRLNRTHNSIHKRASRLGIKGRERK